jgi:hypothetical protein
MSGSETLGTAQVVVRHAESADDGPPLTAGGGKALAEFETDDIPSIWSLQVGGRYVLPDGQEIRVQAITEWVTGTRHNFILEGSPMNAGSRPVT